MPLIRESGVVLRTYKLGEADRIIVFMTLDRGKVRAVAKGVRKTRSKFGSRLEPTSHVNLQLHEGRSELALVTQAESVEVFSAVRSDLDRMGRAASMLEVVDQVAQDGHPDRGLYEMLLGGLRAVEHRASPLVTAAFFLKLLAAEGVGIVVDRCAACGVTEDLVAFDLNDGGVRCSAHRSGVGISPDARALLDQVLGGRLAWALDQPAIPATYEVDRLAGLAMELHVDRRLKALHIIEQM